MLFRTTHTHGQTVSVVIVTLNVLAIVIGYPCSFLFQLYMLAISRTVAINGAIGHARCLATQSQMKGRLYLFTVAKDDRKSIIRNGYVIDSVRRVKTV